MLNKLALGFGRRLPVMLQNEAAECGLVCMGMIAGYYGHRFDVPSLRQRFNTSLKGSTLAQLMMIAGELHLAPRALRLDTDEFQALRLPCILHWNMNHFVVLKKVTSKHLIIHDPASGVRKVPMDEVSHCFSGVALELWPMDGFKRQTETQPVSLVRFIGKLQGLIPSILQVLALAFCIEIFLLVSPFYMQWVIDQVIVSNDQSLLLTLAIGFGLVMLLQHLTTALRSYTLLHISTTLNVQWLSNVLTHLLRLPIGYFERRHVGDVVSRFRAVDEIQRTLTSSFFSAVLDGVMSIAVIGMMLLYSPMLALIALFSMFAYLVLRLLWYRPIKRATEEQIVHEAAQNSHFLETIRGIKTVKLFNAQLERRSRWQNLLVEQVNAGVRTQRLQLLYQLANGVLFGLEHILIIYFGALMVLEGQFTVGALMAFVAYKGMFDQRVAQLIENYFALKMLRIQTGRLGDIVLSEPEDEAVLVDPTKTVSGRRPMAIALDSVKFRYSEQDNWVLDGVTFDIAAGESVAIVGPSGCGKTTLVNLLLGVFSAESGHIYVDGKAVDHRMLVSTRYRAGTVMQDDVLFAGSIMDNITFFDPQLDQERAMESAKMAAIHDDIEDMPMTYHTLVGDMGTVLSGGQKQRILLARAMYRRPDILFLDEATSHLDIDRERQVNDAIRNMQTTRIIIAHRPETIASADRVVVLGNGKIIQDIPAAEFMQNIRAEWFQ